MNPNNLFNPWGQAGFIGAGGPPVVGANGIPVAPQTPSNNFLGGLFDDIFDVIDDIDDVKDWWDENFGGGGGGGGGGFDVPVPIPGGGGGLPDISDFADDTARAAAMNAMSTRADLRQKFIDFLRAVGVYSTWLNQFLNSPFPNWPSFVIDLALMWLSRSQPATAQSTFGGEVAAVIPQSLFAPPPGGGLPVPMPTPVTGFDALAGFMQPVLPATPTIVYRAPPGYVTVTHPQDKTQKAFVMKSIAKAAGLYKERAKAPITGKQWKGLQGAKRAENKIINMAKKTCGTYKITKATRR